jgi:hypothetical protein
MYFLSLNKPSLNFLWKWNYTICNLLCLASFNWTYCFQVLSMLQHGSVLHSLLLLNNIPCVDVVYFIHPFFSWQYLEFTFWILWIIMFMQNFLCGYMFLILFCHIPRSGVAGSYGHSVCKFLRTFPKWLSFYIPTNNVWGFQFLYFLTNTYYLVLVIAVTWHLIVASTYFPDGLRYETSFHRLPSHLFTFIVENGYSNSLPMFGLFICLFKL